MGESCLFRSRAGGIRLISDPWLEGTAFDDGWKLLSPSVFRCEDFATISHIWFSHEHPDHFSPPNLRKISPEIRKRITVLYKRTRDRKVVDFCRKLGFKNIVELPHGRWVRLDDGFDILCQPFGDDSWLYVRTPEITLLNLNDCVIRMEAEARAIHRTIGGASVDVLLTQFSYANWVGNPGDLVAHRAAADEKLERIRTQARVLRPRILIPFASFVWFCHKENFYLNEGFNTIQRAFDFIRTRTDTAPVALYPGDDWEVGAPRDSTKALERYRLDYERVTKAPELVERPPVEPEKLSSEAASYFRRLEADNGPLVMRTLERLGIIRPSKVHVADHDRTYLLAPSKGLVEASALPDEYDVSLSSSAPWYCFKERWGWGDPSGERTVQGLPEGGHPEFRLQLPARGV